MSLPKTTRAWVIRGTDASTGFDNLKLDNNYPVPELGDYDCLVGIQAVSLNYRDLLIPKGAYAAPFEPPVVACSDGAGNVVAVGKKVTDFSVGDKVVTLFNQAHDYGDITEAQFRTGLGGFIDGCLRDYAVFHERGLARSPRNLTHLESGTLTCAPLTAWNALYGLESKAIRPGDCVLTQGTGGVSLAAIQFARAAGAVVIATTSSDEKAERLKKLGANFVINYNKDPKWGETAKKLCSNKEGVDHVIEVGGPATMTQSLKAIKREGVITIIGFLGGYTAEDQPSTLDALTSCCIIRGVLIGSRVQLQSMNRAIEAHNIHPVVDSKAFGFDNVKDAYQYQWDQKNFGKVVIQWEDSER